MNIKLKLFLYAILISASSLGYAVTWTYSVNADGNSVTVTGCQDTCPSILVIPDEITGLSVTAVQGLAFRNNQLSEVTLSKNILSIGDFAFAENQLTSISLPNTTTTIGAYAFWDNDLTEITIPNKVTAIGNNAFKENNLTKVNLGYSLVTIGSFAFYKNVITSLIVPNKVTDIGGGAFQNNEISSLTFPSSVQTIGSGAFAYNSVSELTIPASVTGIGETAFVFNNLTSLEFSGKHPTIGSNSFEANSGLTQITYCSDATGWSDVLISNGSSNITPSGTASACADTDRDTLSDNWEVENGRDPLVADYLIKSVGSSTCMKDDEGIKCWNKAASGAASVISENIGIFDGVSPTCYDIDSKLICGPHSAPLTGSSAETPIPESLGDVSDFGVGMWGMCANTLSELECWGWYGEYQFSTPPVQSAEALSVGKGHACAISNNQLYCWGYGLGYPQNKPPTLTNPAMIRSAKNRFNHSCAFGDEGFKCWGTGLEDGWYGTWTVPNLDQSEVVDYSLSIIGGCALKSDSSTICWGGRIDNLDYSNLAITSENSVQISLSDQLCLLNDTGVICSNPVPQGLMIDPDGDGYSTQNGNDAFPLDSTEWLDTDSDGVGNNADADDDNDDVLDGDDAFPLDSNESLDTDSDGTGNNADTDDDGDSVLDGDDAFPLDATESVDTDSDGVGNNADADDDGDGLDDVLEKSIGTNPFKRDSDFDSLSDKFEVDSKSRDPLVADYSLATGWNHTCVTSDLGVSCWAEESLGRLIPPNNMGSVSQLSLGQSHSCALTKRDGKIYCWDDNGDQQLTLGSGFSQISAGGYHTCALKNEEIVCFGNNSDGQRDSPTLSNVSKVASGPSHACALANNKISCWGKNHLGQTDVPNLSNPVGLFSGGEGHVSCASHDDGWNCWGDESKVSLPPESLSKSADLAIGRNHMCAVDNNKVECWGDNYRNMSTPPDLSNPVQIELGTFHSCALSDSGVDCWGDSSRTSVPSSLRFGDFDGDSTPDDTDTDDDNDGVVDGDDAFPLDATESVDTDSDGIGNNADTDDDGDGVSDIDDTFPLDATESSDFDGDGVGDNTDLVNTTLTFSDGVFDISVKVNDPNDNPVSFIDLRFGAPSSHTCFINATATEIQSEGVYQANIKWAIGNNYTTQKYGVIDDSPVVHFSDGTKLYDQNQYYLDLTNLNSVAPQYKIESFQTAQTDIENEVEFEIIISGFGEDGFLLKYPTSSSGLLDIQVHFANNSDYVGVGFKQNEVEKIANDRYVMRGKVVISDPEDFMNPKLKLVSMCDASMNGKAWEQDSDQDSMIDVLDAFPQDSSEIYDTDSDGVGNNADTDDDNDSVLDGDDAFPLDATETLDTDGDGIGNNADTDDDNDGAVDSDDAFPLDSAESSDSDGDGLGDNADAFPNDSSETVDSDLDGIGDNADVFPNDPTESADTDLDGVGDNADAFPNDASETLDSDSDGTGDNADAFPNNALYKADSDLDGMPDAWETRYGLDPNDSSDATSDQDNDGVTALDEFLAGTIPSGSIDLDGNEDYDALTDGLLLLRGMFGLDGSALVTGTIASDATYTESVDIESRIETLGDLADIDGNGDIDALTDGLLTLRYLFGLQGDTLINGVVAVDATRKTAEEIEAHLETLMPAL